MSNPTLYALTGTLIATELVLALLLWWISGTPWGFALGLGIALVSAAATFLVDALTSPCR